MLIRIYDNVMTHHEISSLHFDMNTLNFRECLCSCNKFRLLLIELFSDVILKVMAINHTTGYRACLELP